jgi:flagellar hook protein FlgE
MLRSMFSAISGLKSNQTYLDIIGNNIANVNTTGFKANRATFAETLWQTSRSATGPQVAAGGVNPVQVGLGSALVGADAVFAQGDLRSTGKLSDLAVDGNGFFILQDGTRQVYTRDGAFDVGADGVLQNPANGMRVMGWTADPTTGAIDTTGPLATITIPLGERTPAAATTTASFSGNLDSRVAAGTTVHSSIEVYDSLGAPHSIQFTFTRAAGASTWDWTAAASADDTAFQNTALGSGQLVFDTAGELTTGTTGTLTLSYTAANGAAAGSTSVDFTRMTQVAENSLVSPFERDGSEPGMFVGFAIDQTGTVIATFSNGSIKPLAQIALADFKNPAGLMRGGENVFELTANSGDPMVGVAGTQGLGSINAGYLEMSNVDLAQQFTNMIIASRGFQANSRLISTADELLQELVNLRR